MRISTGLARDYAVQRLHGNTFKKLLFEALDGAENEFSRHIRLDLLGSGRMLPKEWAALRAEVFARDTFTCQYCQAHGGRLECDHRIPVSRGGDNQLSNLVTACFYCNRSKGAKTVEEWRQVSI